MTNYRKELERAIDDLENIAAQCFAMEMRHLWHLANHVERVEQNETWAKNGEIDSDKETHDFNSFNLHALEAGDHAKEWGKLRRHVLRLQAEIRVFDRKEIFLIPDGYRFDWARLFEKTRGTKK